MTTVLLNNVDHNDLHVITRHGPEFGDAVSQVLVFPTEFESVQREYPIVFRRDAEGALRPVALLGLSRDENLFLDGAGGCSRSMRIIGSPSAVSGAPIFLPQGGNSAYLEHIAGVLRTIYVGHHLLDPMIAAFEGAGLLQPVNLEARVSETEVYAVSEVLTIDRWRLAALGGDELFALHQRGFLQSAFLAAASLGNVQRLADLKSRPRTGGEPQ